MESGLFDIQICRSSREVLLSAPVQVESTVRLPVHYTMDTLFMDLVKDTRAVDLMQPLLDAQSKNMGTEAESDAAKEAITPEMAMAMMENSPVRSSISFGDGTVTREQVLDILEKLNAL